MCSQSQLDVLAFCETQMSSVTDTDSRTTTMSNCFEVDLDSLAIAELLPPKPGSAVGANISPLTLMGKPIKHVTGTMERPVRVVWEPSVFDKIPAATRLNICYEITDPNHQAFFEKLDDKVLQFLKPGLQICSRKF